MKAQKGNSLSARCVGVCPFRRTYASVRNTNHEVGAAILKKRGRKWTKQDEIRRKVHLFLWNEIVFPLFATFSFRKSRNFEKKIGLMVKCTPERGHNALFFIPLEVIIML